MAESDGAGGGVGLVGHLTDKVADTVLRGGGNTVLVSLPVEDKRDGGQGDSGCLCNVHNGGSITHAKAL